MSKQYPRIFRMLSAICVSSLLLLAGRVLAAPASTGFTSIETRQSISILSAAEIDAFAPFTHFASTAYCQPANTLAWNCGGKLFYAVHRRRKSQTYHSRRYHICTANCLANPDFIPTASGGNGSTIQFCKSASFLFPI